MSVKNKNAPLFRGKKRRANKSDFFVFSEFQNGHKRTQPYSNRARVGDFVDFYLGVKPPRIFHDRTHFVGGYRVHAATERNELNEVNIEIVGRVRDEFRRVVKSCVISPLVSHVRVEFAVMRSYGVLA